MSIVLTKYNTATHSYTDSSVNLSRAVPVCGVEVGCRRWGIDPTADGVSRARNILQLFTPGQAGNRILRWQVNRYKDTG